MKRGCASHGKVRSWRGIVVIDGLGSMGFQARDGAVPG